MPLLHGFESPASYRHGYVSIGNFDGVHRGHQAMLAILVERARNQNVPAVALTFDPHPTELLRPGLAPPRLTTIKYRADLLQRYGVDCVIVLPTTQRFLGMSAEEFFHTFIRTELQARGLVEGPNFYFGKNRSGSITVLRGFCNANNLTLDVVSPEVVDEQLVSSSVIRSLVEAGDLAESVRLLGHPYRLTGLVSRGAERGRTLGFPTANLANVETLVPGNGVYAATVQCHGRRILAAVNIGPNPTFGEASRKVEVHLLDFSGDLYGTTIDVDFVQQIRPVMRFASAQELIQQLQRDIAQIRRLFEPS